LYSDIIYVGLISLQDFFREVVKVFFFALIIVINGIFLKIRSGFLCERTQKRHEGACVVEMTIYDEWESGSAMGILSRGKDSDTMKEAP